MPVIWGLPIWPLRKGMPACFSVVGVPVPSVPGGPVAYEEYRYPHRYRTFSMEAPPWPRLVDLTPSVRVVTLTTTGMMRAHPTCKGSSIRTFSCWISGNLSSSQCIELKFQDIQQEMPNLRRYEPPPLPNICLGHKLIWCDSAQL
jgi:hypothetical protein